MSFQVRKRPLNRKEMSRKEDDIVSVHDNSCLSVHEPKLKVSLYPTIFFGTLKNDRRNP